MKDAISFELSPYPMALFNEKGIMPENNKSELYKSLNCIPNTKKDLDGASFVIGGGFLLQKLLWPKNSTLEEVFETYECFISRAYSSNAIIIFDGYNHSYLGIKSYERYRLINRPNSC